MAQIRIQAIEDICPGHRVYRGNVKACDLEPAMWIDFHDEEVNPMGYRRPFNKVERSGNH